MNADGQAPEKELMPSQFDRARQLAAEKLANSEYPLDAQHAENALKWARKLKPDADEVVLLAVYMHDIERGSEYPIREEEFDSYEDYKAAHAAAGGAAAAQIVKEVGYPDVAAERVARLISDAEFSSDNPDTQLVCDADSLSFFDLVIHDYVTKRTPAQIRNKVLFMYARASEKAQIHIQATMEAKSEFAALMPVIEMQNLRQEGWTVEAEGTQTRFIWPLPEGPSDHIERIAEEAVRTADDSLWAGIERTSDRRNFQFVIETATSSAPGCLGAVRNATIWLK